MSSKMINILLTSFPGLNLPSTLSHPVPASTTISDLNAQLIARLPDISSRIIITTTSNKELSAISLSPISSLLSDDHDAILPLRLSVPLCGGKGGFGSQLRAAGGRMSSKRKRNQGENKGSNRNLDGRRLRTVTEAKALAEYLALKPEMDKKEKETRRKRWEQVVELAERREEELKNGSRGRVDGKWVEEKEEAGERTREAVLAAMKSGDYKDDLLGTSSGSSGSTSQDSFEGSDENEIDGASSAPTTPPKATGAKDLHTRTYLGFEEDDEFMSEDEEDAKEPVNEEVGQSEFVGKGKGKGRA